MRRLMESTAVADGGGPSLRKSKKLHALSEISVIHFRAKDQPETKNTFLEVVRLEMRHKNPKYSEEGFAQRAIVAIPYDFLLWIHG